MSSIQSPTPYASDGLSPFLHPSQTRSTETSTRLVVSGFIFCLSLLGILLPNLPFLPHVQVNLNTPQLSHSPLSPRGITISTSPLLSSLSESTLAPVRTYPHILFSGLLLTLSKASFSPRRLSTYCKMLLTVSRIPKSNSIPTSVAGPASSCKYNL